MYLSLIKQLGPRLPKHLLSYLETGRSLIKHCRSILRLLLKTILEQCTRLPLMTHTRMARLSLPVFSCPLGLPLKGFIIVALFFLLMGLIWTESTAAYY